MFGLLLSFVLLIVIVVTVLLDNNIDNLVTTQSYVNTAKLILVVPKEVNYHVFIIIDNNVDSC